MTPARLPHTPAYRDLPPPLWMSARMPPPLRPAERGMSVRLYLA